jgi:hypothetical protein
LIHSKFILIFSLLVFSQLTYSQVSKKKEAQLKWKKLSTWALVGLASSESTKSWEAIQKRTSTTLRSIDGLTLAPNPYSTLLNGLDVQFTFGLSFKPSTVLDGSQELRLELGGLFQSQNLTYYAEQIRKADTLSFVSAEFRQLRFMLSLGGSYLFTMKPQNKLSFYAGLGGRLGVSPAARTTEYWLRGESIFVANDPFDRYITKVTEDNLVSQKQYFQADFHLFIPLGLKFKINEIAAIVLETQAGFGFRNYFGGTASVFPHLVAQIGYRGFFAINKK